ncbi:oligoendopeptidase F [Clostridium beijerinckii]|jgi:oligopeptidase F. Metallo peptidase. MEROPS family M03B|uniref:Oligopeptidase F n=2 Tax=Clostridium beijerinckii TaxID=1520 RepID=A0AAE2V2B3_CLOBE|nr:oligoendopeptidase F [Clostridium beijerinckii]ABR36437.1 oligoendopeptidase F [Clostridium beijerinckii NCIMB 8052]AIU04447.1 oligoendopeptidase F [Clostridium beijerinckii ATCC 35702]MBF7808916.1 oligoendopeptidase F [Clostridium beijerinckii]NRT22497.1 oligoendopeptidase F [Clostridium beijerinckii]NRT64988.1 oligoendopeptidase F [Clostridium beijerinckii]
MSDLKKREEIEDKFKWKVDKIYKSIEDWEKDFEDVKNEAVKLKDFSGKLVNGEAILDYLKFNEKVSRKAENLFIYAHLKCDEDTSNTTYQSLMSKVDIYMAELASYTAFFVPEILSLDDSFIKSEINRLDELKQFEFLIEDILKEKPHILSKEMEELLAAASDCLDAPSAIHNILTNADMTFGKIEDEDGNEVELTEGNYSSFIRGKNREVRKAAFERLFGEYDKLKNTLATSLSASIKTFNFSSRVRKYNNALEASLKPNNIPLEVYKNAIKVINNNLDSLHRYVKIKKKLLGLDEIHMYDLYVPVIEIPKEKIEFNDGVNIVLKALSPLGTEYLDIFKSGVNNGWIDIYENKGKRGGAYSWGGYDTMPYVLLNYNNELGDVSTLAHEMGHSIHSYYSRKEQPYYYANYTLFCAEVASTTNESLLIHYLIENEKDEKKKLYLINQELEQIRTTVFRQLMFAEFELYTHETLEKGIPLTAEDYNKAWHDLNVKYFGNEIVIDKEVDVEWSRIPHFYSDFYVYQYATGYAAASAFSKAILDGKENAVEKYKGFLKSGGSDYPINILRNAGVDMTTDVPIEATIKRFNELLDMIEK